MIKRRVNETDGTEKNERIYVPDYVVFDLETTGISVKTDAVVEISAVKVQNQKVIDEFSSLVNPERPIPFQASEVNGITDAMVRNCPVFETVLAEFLKFIGSNPLVGHNIASFDMQFINRDVMHYWGRTIVNPVIDTLMMAKERLPMLPHRRLTDLAAYYGINPDGAHRALNDCYMNQQVFERLKVEKPVEMPHCPQCGKTLIMRKGRYGNFLGCSGYPKCRYTRNIQRTS